MKCAHVQIKAGNYVLYGDSNILRIILNDDHMFDMICKKNRPFTQDYPASWFEKIK